MINKRKCEGLLDKCINKAKSVIENSDINKENVNEIILVSISLKISIIEIKLKEFFNIPQNKNIKINKDINSDEAIGYKAGIFAAMQSGLIGYKFDDIYLFDVCPFNLGVEAYKNNSEKPSFSIIVNEMNLFL